MRTLFINTRPLHYDDATLVTGLATHGIDYQRLPLLSICPLASSCSEQTHQHMLLEGAYQVLVVVSPTAANLALSTLSDTDRHRLAILSQRTLYIMAVGDATACALRHASLHVHTPIVANNEHMLMLPRIQMLGKNDKVLVWRGVGGRRLLSDTLLARGVNVDAIAWYQRTAPDTLVTNLTTLAPSLTQYHKRLLLISSQQAFTHWQTACRKLQLHLDGFEYLSLGTRLTTLLTQLQLCAHSIDNLEDATLIHAIDSALTTCIQK